MNESGTAVGVYAYVLPVLITVVWCLSWWRSSWQRWALLGVAAVVSVLVVVIGFLIPMPPPGTSPVCSSAFACHPAFGTFWIPVGIYGIGWFVVLLLATSTIDLVRIILRRN